MTFVRVPPKAWQAAVVLLLTVMITLHLRIIFLNSTEESEDFSVDRSQCDRPVVVNLRSKAQVVPMNASQIMTQWVSLNTKYIKIVGHHRPEKGLLTIGVPSIKRINGAQYLMDTLSSLIDKTSPDDKDRVVIMVFLADFDEVYNEKTVRTLTEKFMPFINMGFMQIVQASKEFYPQLTELKRNFNDKPDRVTWRSKQAADFAFMFLYARNMSDYYIQIEDDVVCARNFVTHIENYIQSLKKAQWAVLEFSELGFIGKLFRSSDLHKLAQYILTFYDEQPVDWLITYFRMSMAQKKIMLRKPTLFQHIGLKSSFDTSKDNKLKDKFFDSGLKEHQGDDPPAKIVTKMKHFDKNTPDLAYASGSGFFWAVELKAGYDYSIVFDSPQTLSKVVIVTGNEKNPKDILHRGSVLAAEKLLNMNEQKKEVRCSPFTKLGDFVNGTFVKDKLEVSLNGQVTQCLQIVVTASQDEWVVFNQIAVFVKKQ